MFSKPLLKRNFKSIWKIALIFIAILAMYTTIIIFMFDPEMAEMLVEYQELMPGIMAAVGMTGATGSLIAFINTYLYGFIMLVIPMIFEIIIIYKFVMKYVDNGSMASLLSTPNTRRKIILTQLVSCILWIALIVVITTVIGIVSCNSMFPGDLEVNSYIKLNISVFFLHFALSGIAFFAACLFNEAKNYFTFGAGISIVFYLLNMLANMGGNLKNLKYATIFTLFPGDKIVQGASGIIGPNIILALIGGVLYLLGVITFMKKDLSI